MSINILVTEDESIVRKDIEMRLKKLGYNVVATADTGLKAIELAKAKKPDLALMDIMLKGDMTGIEAAAEIKTFLDIPIIFLTAYSDDSMLEKAKASEPHAYLLKPFKESDVRTSIEMAIHKHGSEKKIKQENEFLRNLATASKSAKYIFVKSKKELVKIPIDEFLMVEALKDYVIIHTTNGQYTIHSTMKEIQKKLPSEHFTRAHRSYIVNVSKVIAIRSGNLVLEGVKDVVPVGGNYKNDISEQINVL
ncbi:MAG: LytR/AlgR family response regulator transcription factor [Flavobacteriales bacterium]